MELSLRKGKYYSEEDINVEGVPPLMVETSGVLDKTSKVLFESLPEYEDRDYPSSLDSLLSKAPMEAFEVVNAYFLLSGFGKLGIVVPPQAKSELALQYSGQSVAEVVFIVESGSEVKVKLSSAIEKPSYVNVKAYISDNAELEIEGFHKPNAFFEERVLMFLEGDRGKGIEKRRFLSLTSTFRAYSQLTHIGKGGFSRSEVKGVLGKEGKGSIEGMIKIMPGASGADSYLTQKTLIIEEGGKAYTYPSLEIENNDVKASHSSLTAFLSEEDIFYLQTRGIPRDRVETMLTAGFLGISEEELSKLISKG